MKSSNPPPRTSKSSLITPEHAIYLLGNKLSMLENKFTKTTNVLETKLGNHETYVTENLPDLECFNTAFSDINKRLLELETLHDRIATLEANAGVKPATNKKKSTLKLNELTDATPAPSFASNHGISFT